MQDRVVIIPASAISHLKKKAKRLQRQTGRPHHELLDEVAMEAGFPNWHHVTVAESATKRLEAELRSSVVILMDSKEAGDVSDADFSDASEVFALRDREIVDWIRHAHEDNRDGTDKELRELLHDSYRCLRYTGKDALPTAAGVIDWFRDFCMWTPSLIWLRGECLDPDAPDIDDGDPENDDDEDTGRDEPMPEIANDELRNAFGASTSRSRLVLGSPDTMERYKGVEGARKAWNWCLHCGRAYPQGSYRQQGDFQMCPYANCQGDAFMDLWTWSRIRKENPAYPETPELGVYYDLYGQR